ADRDEAEPGHRSEELRRDPLPGAGADQDRQRARQDARGRGREERTQLAGGRIRREEQGRDLGLVAELGDEHTREDSQVRFHATTVAERAGLCRKRGALEEGSCHIRRTSSSTSGPAWSCAIWSSACRTA